MRYSPQLLNRMLKSLTLLNRWLSNDPTRHAHISPAQARQLDWLRVVPFVAIHALILFIPLVGISWTAIVLAVFLYLARMFLITGVYHRYFAHRSYRLDRKTQWLAAVLACTAGQRGPLWWAAHHRIHHQKSDTFLDPHSPRQHGFFYSHIGWFLTKGSFATPPERIRDWLRYPELRWLEKYDWLPFVGLAAGCAALGYWLETHYPQTQTSAAQLFIWGFAVSTVVLYHATYTINSLTHGWGKRRFNTGDDSRNNALLALVTLGEGWHNNHHHYPACARMGFYWWELDLTYMGLIIMSRLGIVHDMRPVPKHILSAGRQPLKMKGEGH